MKQLVAQSDRLFHKQNSIIMMRIRYYFVALFLQEVTVSSCWLKAHNIDFVFYSFLLPFASFLSSFLSVIAPLWI